MAGNIPRVPGVPGHGANMPAGSGSRLPIDIGRIMGCSAFRITRLKNLALNLNPTQRYAGILSAETPELAAVRSKVMEMKSGQIMDEAGKTLIEFYWISRDKIKAKAGHDASPSLFEFIEKELPYFNIGQLLDRLIKEFPEKPAENYHKFLVLMQAMEIISQYKHDDFIPAVKEFLFKWFPKLSKIADFDTLLKKINDEDIIKITSILKAAEDRLKSLNANFDHFEVQINTMDFIDAVVISVTAKKITINLLAVSTLSFPIPADIQNHISVEN